jgi:hypothetical protein
LLSLDQALTFRHDTEDDFICTYISHPHTTNHPTLEHILGKHFHETFSPTELTQQIDEMAPINAISEDQSLSVEIYPRKTLNINAKLDPSQQEKLIEMLKSIVLPSLGTILT